MKNQRANQPSSRQVTQCVCIESSPEQSKRKRRVRKGIIEKKRKKENLRRNSEPINPAQVGSFSVSVYRMSELGIAARARFARSVESRVDLRIVHQF